MSHFAWEITAQADLRRIKRDQALMILRALGRFGRTGVGDVRKLTGDKLGRYRFRIGDWRVLFKPEAGGLYRIYSVDNRKDAY